MQYTDGEIRRLYKSAKNRKKQVSILADLNRCSTGRILEIVRVQKDAEGAEAGHGSAEWEPAPGQKALMDRLDELDSQIKVLEDEYRNTVAQLMEIGGEDAGRDIAGN